MTREQENAINNLQRLRKAYIDGRTSFELKKKSVKDDIVSYNIAIQAIKDLDKMNGIALDLASENDDLIEKLDNIRAEILEYKDDKIIHAERNEMIDIMVEIIDKYKAESEG